ncbi:hypothetical protein [Methylorubrum suomiense]|uniref:hypothetical protein n=1 Tax=Methylorubrum suomiense TaxID=144191 RepID=UPI0010F85ACB|nr:MULTISPECIES: hypothetical protein [Methylobacteriaceae]
MTLPRLTGLEYYWFGKSQSVASIYSHHQQMELDPAVADLVLAIKNDAKSCYTGPQSLRRLAERLNNEAADATFMEALSVLDDEKHVESGRRVQAMRCLSSRFLTTADELQMAKMHTKV